MHEKKVQYIHRSHSAAIAMTGTTKIKIKHTIVVWSNKKIIISNNKRVIKQMNLTRHGIYVMTRENKTNVQTLIRAMEWKQRTFCIWMEGGTRRLSLYAAAAAISCGFLLNCGAASVTAYGDWTTARRKPYVAGGKGRRACDVVGDKSKPKKRFAKPIDKTTS